MPLFYSLLFLWWFLLCVRSSYAFFPSFLCLAFSFFPPWFSVTYAALGHPLFVFRSAGPSTIAIVSLRWHISASRLGQFAKLPLPNIVPMQLPPPSLSCLCRRGEHACHSQGCSLQSSLRYPIRKRRLQFFYLLPLYFNAHLIVLDGVSNMYPPYHSKSLQCVRGFVHPCLFDSSTTVSCGPQPFQQIFVRTLPHLSMPGRVRGNDYLKKDESGTSQPIRGLVMVLDTKHFWWEFALVIYWY